MATFNTVEDFLFWNSSSKEDYEKLSADLQNTIKNRVQLLITEFTKFENAAKDAGFTIKINSTWRSYAKQLRLYELNASPAAPNKNYTNSPTNTLWSTNPLTALPDTNAPHVRGSSIDCHGESNDSSKTYDDYVSFAAHYWSTAGKDHLYQFIDESSGNCNGWTHIDIRDSGRSSKWLYISWGSFRISANDYETYLKNRNNNKASHGGSSTSSPNYSGSTYASSSASGEKSEIVAVPFVREQSAVKSKEEAIAAYGYYVEEANMLDLQVATELYEEFAMLMANNQSANYVPTEDDIMAAEALREVEDDLEDALADDPLKDQKVSVEMPSSVEDVANSLNDLFDKTSSLNNTSDITVKDENTETKVEHTRIYQYLAPSILVDGMAYNMDDGALQDKNTVADENYANVNSDSTNTTGSAKATDMTKVEGVKYPAIQIKDTHLTQDEIVKMVISSTDFIPTLLLKIRPLSKNLVKADFIKDGDKVCIFFNADNDNIKSYRADYIVKNVFAKNISHPTSPNQIYEFTILGELDIPKRFDNNMIFSVTDTAYLALITAAEKFGLGFNFCDEEDTNDVQVWHCLPPRDAANPIMDEFIKFVTLHSYKNFNSFFDSWIDFRYALNFININKMLGSEGSDENVDLAFLQNAQDIITGDTGQAMDKKSSEKRAMMPKVLHNIREEAMSMTEFFIVKCKELLDNSISSEGMYVEQVFTIDNPKLKTKDANVSFKNTICVNEDKLKNGFTILGGPGENITQIQADNGDYAKQRTRKKGGNLFDPISTDDIKMIKESKSNALCSGNKHKFFDAAYDHNKLNNGWLKKKQLLMTLNGKNMLLMRGEKIPVMYKDYSADKTPDKQTNTDLLNQVYEQYCGWFIITGITYTYDSNRNDGNSRWTTDLILTRREWPIPGWAAARQKEAIGEIVVTTNIDMDTTLGVLDNGFDQDEWELLQGNNDTYGDIGEFDLATLVGLDDALSDIYKLIKSEAAAKGKTIKLTSARRWGLKTVETVDETGNTVKSEERTDGPSEIYENGSWKFMSSNGNVIWLNSNKSRHIYGEAIDLVNGDGTAFNDVVTVILQSQEILTTMLINGYYCAVEQTKDDTGNTVKHYHIGTIEENDLSTEEYQASWWKQVILYVGETGVNSNGKTYKYADYASFNGNMQTYAQDSNVLPEVTVVGTDGTALKTKFFGDRVDETKTLAEQSIVELNNYVKVNADDINGMFKAKFSTVISDIKLCRVQLDVGLANKVKESDVEDFVDEMQYVVQQVYSDLNAQWEEYVKAAGVNITPMQYYVTNIDDESEINYNSDWPITEKNE